MSKELIEVSGLVFKQKKYKDFDVLSKIMTAENGIFTLLIKGGLKPKSRLLPATINFSYGNYLINTNYCGLSVLRNYKVVHQLEHIYFDFKGNAYANYLLDLVDHAYADYQPLGKNYYLVFNALVKINEGIDNEIICQMVELKLLSAFGTMPEFRHCVFCDASQGIFDFSLPLGGIVCKNHFGSANTRMCLDVKTMGLIRTLALIDIQQLGQINISDNLKQQSRKFIDILYEQYLDLHLKTKKYLKEVL